MISEDLYPITKLEVTIHLAFPRQLSTREYDALYDALERAPVIHRCGGLTDYYNMNQEYFVIGFSSEVDASRMEYVHEAEDYFLDLVNASYNVGAKFGGHIAAAWLNYLYEVDGDIESSDDPMDGLVPSKSFKTAYNRRRYRWQCNSKDAYPPTRPTGTGGTRSSSPTTMTLGTFSRASPR
ncbi:MAG: hypothetical protein E7Z63_01085 [Thermoplasmata archaeon]|nr:hypothetical protein [Thermoplasmata archaeon]